MSEVDQRAKDFVDSKRSFAARDRMLIGQQVHPSVAEHVADEGKYSASKRGCSPENDST